MRILDRPPIFPLRRFGRKYQYLNTMKKLYYVSGAMCGNDLPDDFDLDDFCEVLQGKLDEDVEVVAVSESEDSSDNLDPDLVSDAIFTEALGEYYHR